MSRLPTQIKKVILNTYEHIEDNVIFVIFTIPDRKIDIYKNSEGYGVITVLDDKFENYFTPVIIEKYLVGEEFIFDGKLALSEILNEVILKNVNQIVTTNDFINETIIYQTTPLTPESIDLKRGKNWNESSKRKNFEREYYADEDELPQITPEEREALINAHSTNRIIVPTSPYKKKRKSLKVNFPEILTTRSKEIPYGLEHRYKETFFGKKKLNNLKSDIKYLSG